MAQLVIAPSARADLDTILETSLERWGEIGRARYAALLRDAMRAIARRPDDASARLHPELSGGLRSVHLRRVRATRSVKSPVHVLFYRYDGHIVEVVRILHERAEPALHFDE